MDSQKTTDSTLPDVTILHENALRLVARVEENYPHSIQDTILEIDGQDCKLIQRSEWNDDTRRILFNIETLARIAATYQHWQNTHPPTLDSTDDHPDGAKLVDVDATRKLIKTK